MAKISHCQGGLNQPGGLRMFKVGTKITKITKGFPQGMGKLKKIDLAMECYADGPNGSFYARNPFRQEFPWQFGADHGAGEHRLPISPIWPRESQRRPLF